MKEESFFSYLRRDWKVTFLWLGKSQEFEMDVEVTVASAAQGEEKRTQMECGTLL